jgi:simple sugar transport system substrate-binding protein
MSNGIDLKRHRKHLRDLSRRDVLATMAKLGLGGALGAAALSGDPREAFAAMSREFAGAHPKWKFIFVNHVTTNPFFTPTISGAADASKLFGVSYQWTGSQTSNVTQMVSAMNNAIAAKADGIAVSIIDKTAFNKPTADALAAGIPVVSYNADGGIGNTRLAYIGQDLFGSGQAMGKKILSLVKPGGKIVIFIATPGSGNIQPRVDGAKAVIGSTLKVDVVATGPLLPQEASVIDSYYLGHKDINGMFAVDAGSTLNTALTSKKYGLHAKGVASGGFDLQPGTLAAINSGDLDFTIDQQPYQQGFLPVLYLWLYKLSGGLQTPSTTNTGLSFVTKDNVTPYLSPSYFEGSPHTTSPI